MAIRTLTLGEFFRAGHPRNVFVTVDGAMRDEMQACVDRAKELGLSSAEVHSLKLWIGSGLLPAAKVEDYLLMADTLHQD